MSTHFSLGNVPVRDEEPWAPAHQIPCEAVTTHQPHFGFLCPHPLVLMAPKTGQ